MGYRSSVPLGAFPFFEDRGRGVSESTFRVYGLRVRNLRVEIAKMPAHIAGLGGFQVENH